VGLLPIAREEGVGVARTDRGFTLVELMVVVVVIGLLAAIAIPNYLASESRAREAGVKSNMHTFQLATEDFRVRSDSAYAGHARDVAPLLQGAFRNPFDKGIGENQAWEDREYLSGEPGMHPGLTSYSDSAAGGTYNIKGRGKDRTMDLVLTNGR
jgi:prepilin-type N-terminal cleavage/methylation domain-containing protein